MSDPGLHCTYSYQIIAADTGPSNSKLEVRSLIAMSSFETIRVHPGRLPSTAYTPYGDPLNPPPTWDAPPPDHPTSSASTSHIVRFGSEPRTPPPPYSDHGESYDQHASFLDEESVSGDEGDDYEEYFEGEDGYDEEWEEDIHALEREIEGQSELRYVTRGQTGR